MQAYAAVRVGAFGTVFEIAFDGTSYRSQLTAYLVVSACLQVDFQKTIVLAFHECFIRQDSQFGVFALCSLFLPDYKTLVQFLIAREIVLQACFGHFRTALHDRPIGLFYRNLVCILYSVLCILYSVLCTLFPEHLVQPHQRLARPGKEHYPARRPVQPVRHAQKDLAGLVILRLDIRLHRLAQRRVSGLIALHNLVAGLVDGNNMVVFV